MPDEIQYGEDSLAFALRVAEFAQKAREQGEIGYYTQTALETLGLLAVRLLGPSWEQRFKKEFLKETSNA